jgi:hypothetical protein
MYSDIYDNFMEQLLNSQRHLEARDQWLWKAFLKLHIGRPLMSLIYYERESPRSLVNLEKSIVADEDRIKWTIWCAWKKRLLRAKNIAPELAFHQSYN